MKIYRHVHLIVIFIIFVVGNFGCEPQPHTLNKNTPDNSPKKISLKTHETKPGAPIHLMSTNFLSLNPNQATYTEIVLSALGNEGVVDIEIVPSLGLQLVDTQTTLSFDLRNATNLKVPATLFATTDGHYYLNLHIQYNTVDAVLTRNLSVIVQVGTPIEKGTQLKKSAGENIIVLPAQESTSKL